MNSVSMVISSQTIQGSRAIRRILCLATHFINSQCRSCEQILFALFALQKCLDKRYSFFTRSMNGELYFVRFVMVLSWFVMVLSWPSLLKRRSHTLFLTQNNLILLLFMG